MIRLAIASDLPKIAMLLQHMYIEVFEAQASTNFDDYMTDIMLTYTNPKKYIYIDSEFKGFFILSDEYSNLLPNNKRFQGTDVYIVPKYRKGKLLKQFYDKLFLDFPDGDILGVTELNSEHINVCNKRHKHILNVYVLNRSI